MYKVRYFVEEEVPEEQLYKNAAAACNAAALWDCHIGETPDYVEVMRENADGTLDRILWLNDESEGGIGIPSSDLDFPTAQKYLNEALA